MPAPQYSVYNFVAGSTASPNATEGIIATSRSVSSSYAGCVFAVEFDFDYLSGAGTTAVVYRIRQQSLTGTAIYTSPSIPLAASTQSPHIHIAATDAPTGEVASIVYVLTVIQTAGTGAGSATNAFSRVTVAE